jgi:hypothetical protein
MVHSSGFSSCSSKANNPLTLCCHWMIVIAFSLFKEAFTLEVFTVFNLCLGWDTNRIIS